MRKKALAALFGGLASILFQPATSAQDSYSVLEQRPIRQISKENASETLDGAIKSLRPGGEYNLNDFNPETAEKMFVFVTADSFNCLYCRKNRPSFEWLARQRDLYPENVGFAVLSDVAHKEAVREAFTKSGTKPSYPRGMILGKRDGKFEIVDGDVPLSIYPAYQRLMRVSGQEERSTSPMENGIFTADYALFEKGVPIFLAEHGLQDRISNVDDERFQVRWKISDVQQAIAMIQFDIAERMQRSEIPEKVQEAVSEMRFDVLDRLAMEYEIPNDARRAIEMMRMEVERSMGKNWLFPEQIQQAILGRRYNDVKKLAEEHEIPEEILMMRHQATRKFEDNVITLRTGQLIKTGARNRYFFSEIGRQMLREKVYPPLTWFERRDALLIEGGYQSTTKPNCDPGEMPERVELIKQGNDHCRTELPNYFAGVFDSVDCYFEGILDNESPIIVYDGTPLHPRLEQALIATNVNYVRNEISDLELRGRLSRFPEGYVDEVVEHRHKRDDSALAEIASGLVVVPSQTPHVVVDYLIDRAPRSLVSCNDERGRAEKIALANPDTQVLYLAGNGMEREGLWFEWCGIQTYNTRKGVLFPAFFVADGKVTAAAYGITWPCAFPDEKYGSLKIADEIFSSAWTDEVPNE